jgi:hypothetical protein
MNHMTRITIAAAALSVALTTATSAAPTTNFGTNVHWSSEYGTDGDDRAWGVAVTSSGDVYQAGSTNGAFAGTGSTNSNGNDGFIAKYKRDGTPVWLVEFGFPNEHDNVSAVAAASSGDVYVAGQTGGAFPSFTNSSGSDLFVARFTKNGVMKWVQQLGAAGSGDVNATGVAVASSGDVYVTGTTETALPGQTFLNGFNDAFVAKYSSSGALKWVREFGTDEEDDANAVAVSSAGIFVAGHTYGQIPGAGSNPAGVDGFLVKYDKNGVQKTAVQFASVEDDEIYGVATKGNDVYVAGYTYGNFSGTNLGGSDVLLVKYDKNLVFQWAKQFGTTDSDFGLAVAVAKNGNVYVSGETDGALPGFANAGDQDGLVAGFTKTGTQVLLRQWGAPTTEEGTGIGILKSGDVVVGGYTGAAYTGLTFAGEFDAYLITFAPS